MEINKNWTVIKDIGIGSIENISNLEATPVKWVDALTLSSGMSYEDLFEGLGPQMNTANDEEFKDMRNRWGKYILIFPGTQCQDTAGDIFVPSIRYTHQMIQLGEVRMAWDFEWFNYTKWEEYQHKGRLGATGYVLDINNHYDGIAVLKGGDK